MLADVREGGLGGGFAARQCTCVDSGWTPGVKSRYGVEFPLIIERAKVRQPLGE